MHMDRASENRQIGMYRDDLYKPLKVLQRVFHDGLPGYTMYIAF